MARPNKSQFALLGMLTLGPASGYDLKKLFEGSLGNFWAESYGQIYPMLRRLVGQGWAEVRAEPQEGHPGRKVYAITPAGRAALGTWLEEPADFPVYRLEPLLKLFFGPEMPPETSRRHVERYRDGALQMLARYEALEPQLRREHPAHPGLPYWLMTLDYGRSHYETVVAWCERTLQRLAEGSAGG